MDNAKQEVYDVWLSEEVFHRYFVIAASEEDAKRIARINHSAAGDKDNVVWVESETSDRGVTAHTARADSGWYTDGGTAIDPEWEDEPLPVRLTAAYEHACRRQALNIHVNVDAIKVVDDDDKEWSVSEVY